jgi:hypothetical protein
MKNIRNSFQSMLQNTSHIASVIFLIGILFTQVSQAQNPYPTATITVTGLTSFVSHVPGHTAYLSAFYSVGNVSGLSMQQNSSELFISKVYVKVQDFPITSDSVVLPATSFHWSGFSKPNVLLLVVHNQKQYTWLNTGVEGRQPNYTADPGDSEDARKTTTETLGAIPAFTTVDGIQLTSNYNFVSFSAVAFRSLAQNAANNQVTYQFNSARPLADFLRALPSHP